MRTSCTLHRRRILAATALVAILLVLPFTATYGRVAGLVEQGLYVLALLMAVIALGLLFAPVAHAVLGGDAEPVREQGDRLTRTGRAVLIAAAVCAGVLLVDLGAAALIDPPVAH
jgi:hypothetical protein